MAILPSSPKLLGGPLTCIWPHTIKKWKKEDKKNLMASYSVLYELVSKNIFTRNKLTWSSLNVKKNGVKLRPGSKGRLGSRRGLGRGMCVWGGGVEGEEEEGESIPSIKNNNPHVKIKCSILLNLFLFKVTIKCMQVRVKAKNLNTFILHIEFAFPLIKRVRVAIS